MNNQPFKKNLAIVGATGAVGTAFIELLEEDDFFKDCTLSLFASSRSAGKKIPYRGKELTIIELTPDYHKDIDIAFFSAGSNISKEYAHYGAENGTVIIDNSSYFRLFDEVPLIVPEVNPEDVKKHKNIIANPNCSTIQMCVALKPLHDAYNIKRVIASTYQATSGAGNEGMEELMSQVEEYGKTKKDTFEFSKFSREILFNVIPQIDVFEENNYTKEEMKMNLETKKIMHIPDLLISSTCVRVPTMRSHGEAITIEFTNDIENDMTAIKDLLEKSAGIKVHRENKDFPTPKDCAKTHFTHIGRIRKDTAFEHGLSIWIVADQIYKGASLNAIQIAKLL